MFLQEHYFRVNTISGDTPYRLVLLSNLITNIFYYFLLYPICTILIKVKYVSTTMLHTVTIPN